MSKTSISSNGCAQWGTGKLTTTTSYQQLASNQAASVTVINNCDQIIDLRRNGTTEDPINLKVDGAITLPLISDTNEVEIKAQSAPTDADIHFIWNL